MIDTRRWQGRGELASIDASRRKMTGKRGTSGSSCVDRSEGRDDPSAAGGALGVSSDAKDEPKRGAAAAPSCQLPVVSRQEEETIATEENEGRLATHADAEGGAR